MVENWIRKKANEGNLNFRRRNSNLFDISSFFRIKTAFFCFLEKKRRSSNAIKRPAKQDKRDDEMDRFASKYYA